MGPKERQARHALISLLKLADVPDDLSDVPAVADAIARKEFSHYTVGKINEALNDFSKKYGQTDIAQENAPILDALANANRPPQGQGPFKPRWRQGW